MISEEKRIEYNRNRKLAKEKKINLLNEKQKEEYFESKRQSVRNHYENNKSSLSEKKRKYYLINKDKILENCKKYRTNNPKEKSGNLGTGNYNITLAERHKEQWLKEELFLYRLKITDTDGTIFYKCGLAKNIRNRLYHIPYDVDVIEAVKMTKYDAIYSERDILKNKIKYSPLIKFGGHTECFIEKD